MANAANITRRSALTSIAAIPVCGLAGSTTAAEPRARLAAAVAELKAAAMAVDPTITRWSTVVPEDAELRCGYLIYGTRGAV